MTKARNNKAAWNGLTARGREHLQDDAAGSLRTYQMYRVDQLILWYIASSILANLGQKEVPGLLLMLVCDQDKDNSTDCLESRR